MFDITKEVPSLELCKKLKDLGFPQDRNGWWWCIENRLPEDEIRLLFGERIVIGEREWFKAFTIRELCDILPHKVKDKYDLIILKTIEGWSVSYETFSFDRIVSLINFNDKKLANALAKMLIWLREKDYLNFHKHQ